ncbi:MAG TPA: NADH-quinone oxidoreductase subunit L, partial [bacterium]|nr:NADH-quinone oxidoreductase subunit L [bacterium]
IILAVLSVGGGWIGIPAVLGGGNHFAHFLAPVFAASAGITGAGETGPHQAGHDLELLLMGAVLLAVLFSLWLAWLFYGRKSNLPARTAQKLGGVYTLVFNKYYVDELYGALIARPLRRFSESALWRFIDARVIDGTINGTAALMGAGSRVLSRIQTGVVQNYALLFVFGVIALLFYLFF